MAEQKFWFADRIRPLGSNSMVASDRSSAAKVSTAWTCERLNMERLSVAEPGNTQRA